MEERREKKGLKTSVEGDHEIDIFSEYLQKFKKSLSNLCGPGKLDIRDIGSRNLWALHVQAVRK